MANLLTVTKPLIPPQVSGSSVFASGVGYNTYVPGRRQTFGLLTDFDAVRENLRNIIFFRKNEYLDDGDFGMGLQDYQFEQENELLNLAISQEMRRQIAKYESRCLIRSLSVYTALWADNALAIDMDALINNTPASVQAGSNGVFNVSQKRAA